MQEELEVKREKGKEGGKVIEGGQWKEKGEGRKKKKTTRREEGNEGG